ITVLSTNGGDGNPVSYKLSGTAPVVSDLMIKGAAVGCGAVWNCCGALRLNGQRNYPSHPEVSRAVECVKFCNLTMVSGSFLAASLRIRTDERSRSFGNRPGLLTGPNAVSLAIFIFEADLRLGIAKSKVAPMSLVLIGAV
ncbi:MAG: hypothetical protein JOY75_18910, partial [Hyphomicrobiales bacterium]|nr:hypothetical protein [Hyphomicrobiales bacterium]